MKLPALFSLLVLSVGVGTAQDDAKAQTKLGTDYLLGRGVEQDRDQGFKLIRGAAEKGGSEAQRILGNLYEYGVGAPINLKESAKWRRKAAGQGDGKAARALGQMYLAGEGVSSDKSLAFLWMRRAAEQGDLEVRQPSVTCIKKVPVSPGTQSRPPSGTSKPRTRDTRELSSPTARPAPPAQGSTAM